MPEPTQLEALTQVIRDGRNIAISVGLSNLIRSFSPYS
jgi:hypothetical protein